MLADLPENTLLTADAGFISDGLRAQLIDGGKPFVPRTGGNKTLLENLEDDGPSDENIVYLWPEKSRSDPPLKPRRIRFQSTGGFPVVLMANVLDSESLSDADARRSINPAGGLKSISVT